MHRELLSILDARANGRMKPQKRRPSILCVWRECSLVEAKYDPCCGIDVHKKLLVACIRSGDESVIQEFGTTTAEIMDMIHWIQEHNCQMTVMESTGSYWMPVWNIFEDNDVPVMLANAQQVKAVPGKKTDKKDAEWLAQLLSEGHVQPSFIPDRKHRELRSIIVQRSKYVKIRAAELNRLQKILTTTNTQLSNVVSDIAGKSAQRLIEETIENGPPSADKIREMQAQKIISRRLKATPEEISAALDGAISDEVHFMVKHILDCVDCLNTQIQDYTEKIYSMLDDREHLAAQMLQTIPGVGQDSAYIIVGIIGCDMSRFETADKLCSWAGVVPANNESAGKRKPVRTTKGHTLLKSTLVVCGNSASHAKNTFLRARYLRLAPRIGAKKAIMAVAHSIMRAVWWILATGALYTDLGADYYKKREEERIAKAHIRGLKRIGLHTESVEEELEEMIKTGT